MNLASARLRPMATVDVFTQVAYAGNPVTVVLDGEGLDSAAMLAFTRWTQLSEATFVLPPSPAARAQGADYQVRIFSPAGEMDFAGHPTLGTCHAWLSHGGQPQTSGCIVQECRAGLVTIAQSHNGLAFAAPAAHPQPEPPASALTTIYQALGIEAAQVQGVALLHVGTPWLCIRLASAQVLGRLQPERSSVQALAALFDDDVGLGLCALLPAAQGLEHRPADFALEVRAFTLDGAEDPVTGSLNACLAQWLTQQGLLSAPYQARQGRCVGRDGHIGIAQDARGQLWIQGQSTSCVTGQVLL